MDVRKHHKIGSFKPWRIIIRPDYHLAQANFQEPPGHRRSPQRGESKPGNQGGQILEEVVVAALRLAVLEAEHHAPVAGHANAPLARTVALQGCSRNPGASALPGCAASCRRNRMRRSRGAKSPRQPTGNAIPASAVFGHHVGVQQHRHRPGLNRRAAARAPVRAAAVPDPRRQAARSGRVWHRRDSEAAPNIRPWAASASRSSYIESRGRLSRMRRIRSRSGSIREGRPPIGSARTWPRSRKRLTQLAGLLLARPSRRGDAHAPLHRGRHRQPPQVLAHRMAPPPRQRPVRRPACRFIRHLPSSPCAVAAAPPSRRPRPNDTMRRPRAALPPVSYRSPARAASVSLGAERSRAASKAARSSGCLVRSWPRRLHFDPSRKEYRA